MVACTLDTDSDTKIIYEGTIFQAKKKKKNLRNLLLYNCDSYLYILEIIDL